MSHEPEKRVTPVFLRSQAESFGRHHSSSRFGNPDGRAETRWGTERCSICGAEPAIAPPKSPAERGVCQGNARWQGSTLQSSSRSLSDKCWSGDRPWLLPSLL